MLDKETFRLKAIERIRVGKEHCSKWHSDARDDYAFVAGDQWEAEDVEILREQNRPIVVFNYSEKMIDAVGGAEVSGRQECTYKPRGIEDGPLAELWTNAGRWVRDECLAEDEETDAFRDALICGMGWIDTKMDYTENKDGMPIMDRVDPIEMIWDPAAIKPGLADRRWDAQGVFMDDDLIKMRWPGQDVVGEDMDAFDMGSVWHVQPGNRYNSSVNGGDGSVDEDKRVDQTLVWAYECFEMESYYRVDDGNGGVAEMDVGTFGKMRKQLDQFQLKYVKLWKKVYYKAWLADDKILEWGLCPVQCGFLRQCITGKRDRNKNTWYGLTRVMKDPQRWANKWLSQIMYIINSNAKGGLLAEEGAFKDPRKAQDEWSKPDSVTLLTQGGIDKIKEKQMTAYPSGLAQLMEFALNSLPQVTGINLEALGLANRDQANVLEQSRKQAAYGLLAPIFDSLKRYRKMQGKILLYLITEFISDGRMIRVAGPGSEQFIPLTKQPNAVEFDIIVDQSPNAPDVKQQTWDTLMQIVPNMVKEGIPIPPDLLTYAPLPSALVMKWQQFITQQQQNQAISPEQVKQMQEQMQQLQEENQKLQQDNSAKLVEANTKQAEARHTAALKEFELQSKMELAAKEHEGKMALQKQAQDHSMQLQQQTTDGGLKIKAAAAGLDPEAQKEISMKVDTTDIAETLKEITGDFTAAITKVVEAMNEPKQVVRDAKGNVIGVKPVPKLVK